MQDQSVSSTPTPTIQQTPSPVIVTADINPSTTTSQTPQPEAPGNKIFAIAMLLVLMFGLTAGLVLIRQTQILKKFAKQPEPGKIAIFKHMCTNVGQKDTCSGRDMDLDGYKIDFLVFPGLDITSTPLQTITVALNENDQGHGNTGNGSQGRNTSSELETGTYTVCEVPTAYKDSQRISLNPFPRPKASEGGSSGGTNQTQFQDNCITVDINSGEAELKFLNTKAQMPVVAQDTNETPDASTLPSASPTSTATLPPNSPSTPPTQSPSSSPTASPSASPEATANTNISITTECTNLRIYDENWQPLSFSDAKKLRPGNLIRLVVTGTADSGQIDKARFTVNSESSGEITQKAPSTEGFYVDYILPSNTKDFKVEAQVHHSKLGWF